MLVTLSGIVISVKPLPTFEPNGPFLRVREGPCYEKTPYDRKDR